MSDLGDDSGAGVACRATTYRTSPNALAGDDTRASNHPISTSTDMARVPVASEIRPIHRPDPASNNHEGTTDATRARTLRVQHLVSKHFRMVWRVAQRLGLQSADAEDVALRVMMIAANRIDDIAECSERSFLVNTARFVVAKFRKSRDRRAEDLGEDLSGLPAGRTQVDEIADQRRALQQLDRVLRELPDNLRTVFVLFEIEGFSQSEIGTTLGIPQGTVASRIRRAKSRFLRIAQRHLLLPRGTT